jgi:hypothetical protein
MERPIRQEENPGMLCTGENCGCMVYVINITDNYDWLCDDCHTVYIEDKIMEVFRKAA